VDSTIAIGYLAEFSVAFEIFRGRNSSGAKRLIMVPDSALECREKLELCKKTYLNTPSESITL